MKYFTNLFSPETYRAFSESTRSISGFRPTQTAMADRINVGDILICYVTGLSRWVGYLEVVSAHFNDSEPIFVPKDDPFSLRFKVKTHVWLPFEKAIPIRTPDIWNELTFTREHIPTSSRWTGQVRNSLRSFHEQDGKFLVELLRKQQQALVDYPLSEEDNRVLKRQTVRRLDREVEVTIPSSEPMPSDIPEKKEPEIRESIQIQALLGRIGATMGMKVWVPANDKARILDEWPDGTQHLLEELPLNYNDTTLGTIERIDVLWLKGRAIQRAFEVEHTTSIYSGILRMADLLALQPNMDIRLHLVAPVERRSKVFEEIRRPVFSLLERKPLAEMCTFISYDSLREVGQLKHLSHLSDSVLDEYAEEAE